MVNKGFVVIYLKQQEKTQNKKPTLYTPKGNIKNKQNKKKKLTRKVRYVNILLSQGEKIKIEIKSEIEIKMGY